MPYKLAYQWIVILTESSEVVRVCGFACQSLYHMQLICLQRYNKKMIYANNSAFLKEIYASRAWLMMRMMRQGLVYDANDVRKFNRIFIRFCKRLIL